jgi:hypothetical protein
VLESYSLTFKLHAYPIHGRRSILLIPAAVAQFFRALRFFFFYSAAVRYIVAVIKKTLLKAAQRIP